jgi:tRNA/rRNA methyltransferase
METDNLIVILVKPKGPINIGSVARAMMNFGFSKLRLVAPAKGYLSLPARKMALTAFSVVEKAQVFDDLNSALADVQVAFGTTRRFGKYRKHFATPAGAAGKIRELSDNVSCALVMGPEDTGLETKDLDLCQHFIYIPTHEGYPSMNLSHALSVLLYEIFKGCDQDKAESGVSVPRNLANIDDLEHMYDHMRETFLSIDFLDPQSPEHLLRVFRRIFGAAGLSSRDVRIIRGLMRRIDWTENERRKTI